MFNEKDFDALNNATVYDRDGDKVGKVGRLYVDDETNEPNWVTVNTGFFGTNESFVPIDGVTLDGDRLQVPFEKAKIKDAPNIDSDGHLSPAEEEELYRYYGRDYARLGGDGRDRDNTTAGVAGAAGTVGVAGTRREHDADAGADRSLGDRVKDTFDSDAGADGGADGGADAGADGGADGGADRGADAGADRDRTDTHRDRDAAGTMTASEERLNVGTEQVETGRARLRRHVTTEQQTVDVPVEKEVLTVERESVSGDTRSGGRIGDAAEDEEIVLREERPVVSKEVHDVERVSVGKETVTDHEQVTEDVKKEHIEVEGEENARGRDERRR